MSPPISLEVSWFWDWVPAGEDAPAWIAYVSRMLDDWAGSKVAAARAGQNFPFATDEIGEAVAEALLQRAAALPANCRLIWGAGFVNDDVRWLPLLILAEFRRARPGDSSYLMTEVGAEGFAEDVRDPRVDYVTTDRGDGVRVVALAESEGEGLHARVDAALRLETPGRGDVDVLLSTRVKGMDKAGAIGAGVEVAMHMIASQAEQLPFGDPT
ncbi:MAG TPA: hypothetical protein VGD29_10455 [Actinoplanes sp.]|jgi:hypothetical protein